MTTVVALASGGLVAMAADTACSLNNRQTVGLKKILRVKAGDETALLGWCGDGAGGVLLRVGLCDGLERAAGDDEDLQDWADVAAATITRLYVDAGVLDDGKMDGNMLLGFRGRLWTVVHAHAVPHVDGVASIGTGGDVALGAAIALRRHTEMTPVRVVSVACDTAIANDCYSGGPAVVEVVGDMSPEA